MNMSNMHSTNLKQADPPLKVKFVRLHDFQVNPPPPFHKIIFKLLWCYESPTDQLWIAGGRLKEWKPCYRVPISQYIEGKGHTKYDALWRLAKDLPNADVDVTTGMNPDDIPFLALR